MTSTTTSVGKPRSAALRLEPVIASHPVLESAEKLHKGIAGTVYSVDETTSIKVFSHSSGMYPSNAEFQMRGSPFNELTTSRILFRIFGTSGTAMHVKCIHHVGLDPSGRRIVYKCPVTGCSSDHDNYTRGIPSLGNHAQLKNNTHFSVMERLAPAHTTAVRLANLAERCVYASNMITHFCHMLAVMHTAQVFVPAFTETERTTIVRSDKIQARQTVFRAPAKWLHGDIKLHNILDRVRETPRTVSVVIPDTGETISYESSIMPVLGDYGMSGFIRFPDSHASLVQQSLYDDDDDDDDMSPVLAWRARPLNTDMASTSDTEIQEDVNVGMFTRFEMELVSSDFSQRTKKRKRDNNAVYDHDRDDTDSNPESDTDATCSPDTPKHRACNPRTFLANAKPPKSDYELFDSLYNLSIDSSNSIACSEDFAVFSTRSERAPEIELLFILCAYPRDDPPFAPEFLKTAEFESVYARYVGQIHAAVDAYALGKSMLRIIIGQHAYDQMCDIVTPLCTERQPGTFTTERINSDCIPPYTATEEKIHTHRINTVVRKIGVYIVLKMLRADCRAKKTQYVTMTHGELLDRVVQNGDDENSETDKELVHAIALISAIITGDESLVRAIAASTMPGSREQMRIQADQCMHSSVRQSVVRLYSQLLHIFTTAATRINTTLDALIERIHDIGIPMLLHPSKPQRQHYLTTGRPAVASAVFIATMQRTLASSSPSSSATRETTILGFDTHADTLQRQQNA